MKKTILYLTLVAITGCSLVGSLTTKRKQELNNSFSVKDCIVYYKGEPIAKYQAKTFSLDGGELVEEYNLLMTTKLDDNKQIIGDLIDYVSERHQGAEVEVEVESKNSPFEL